MLIAWALSNEYIGMANTFANPNRVLGWISYFAIESYGSLLVRKLSLWYFTCEVLCVMLLLVVRRWLCFGPLRTVLAA